MTLFICVTSEDQQVRNSSGECHDVSIEIYFYRTVLSDLRLIKRSTLTSYAKFYRNRIDNLLFVRHLRLYLAHLSIIHHPPVKTSDSRLSGSNSVTSHTVL